MVRDQVMLIVPVGVMFWVTVIVRCRVRVIVWVRVIVSVGVMVWDRLSGLGLGLRFRLGLFFTVDVWVTVVV